MKLNDFNKRVVLQKKTTTDDGMGGIVETWTDIDEMWAAIEPVDMKEKSFAQQIGYTITHKIYIRYRNDVAPGDRIVYDGTVYKIVSVINPKEADVFLELLCEGEV